MTVRITDQEGRPIQESELKVLELWNETVSHICATAMARMPQNNSNANNEP